MDDTDLVGSMDTTTDLQRKMERLVKRQGGPLFDDRFQALAQKILHRNEQGPFEFTEIVDADDICMGYLA